MTAIGPALASSAPFRRVPDPVRHNAKVTQNPQTAQRVITYREREWVALGANQMAELADALGVSADFLLGRSSTPPRGNGPAGKLRQVFDQASRLPRHQQCKLVEFLENYLRGIDSQAA